MQGHWGLWTGSEGPWTDAGGKQVRSLEWAWPLGRAVLQWSTKGRRRGGSTGLPWAQWWGGWDAGSGPGTCPSVHPDKCQWLKARTLNFVSLMALMSPCSFLFIFLVALLELYNVCVFHSKKICKKTFKPNLVHKDSGAEWIGRETAGAPVGPAHSQGFNFSFGTSYLCLAQNKTLKS